MNKKGFTLVEILVAIVILMGLLAIAIPLYARFKDDAKEARTQGELSSVYKAISMYHAYNGRYPKNFDELSSYIAIPDIEQKYELNPDL